MRGGTIGCAARGFGRALALAVALIAIVLLPQTAQAAEGVKLETAPWVPARNASHGWWGAAPAGAGPDQRVQWSRDADSLALPPGAYDIYWVQDYETSDKPLLLAAGVQVAAGEVATVRADTGVKLEVAPWVPARNASHGWWGAVPAGAEPKARVNWTKTADAVLLPPGAYDIYWVQDYETSDKPLLLAPGVQVTAGQISTVPATSGLALKLPADTPALDQSHGWWGVTPAGGAAEDRIHWSKGRADQPLLLPPGTYDVFWKQDYNSAPERRAADVTVGAGQLVEVDLGAPDAEPRVASEAGAPGTQAQGAQAPAATAPAAQAQADGATGGAQPRQKSVLTSFGVMSDEASGIGANFPEGTHRVDATYQWKAATPGTRIDLRWSKDGQMVLEQNEDLTEPEGNSRWYLAMQSGSPLPPGSYQVEILENGLALVPPMPFTIGQAGKADKADADLAAALGAAESGSPAPGEAAPGEQIAADDFDDPASQWSQRDEPGVQMGYADGGYRIALSGTQTFALGAQLGATFDDAVIEVDATPGPGSPGHPYGVFVRSPDSGSYHAFVIGADGSYAAFHVDQGSFALDSAANATMPAGTLKPDGQTNRLRLVANGAQLAFSVNGTPIVTVEQAKWPSGRAGVLAGNPGTGDVAVTFDNWRVWRIAGPGGGGAETAAAAAPAVSPGSTDFSQYAPADPNAAIKEVALGYADADEDGFDPARAGTVFPQGVSQVVAWYRFAGAEPGTKLTARWYLGEALLYERDLGALEKPDGKGWVGLVNTSQMPLPAGSFRVELTENGQPVTAIPFRIEPRSASAVPWGTRGWQHEADGSYRNAEHDLRLAVPEGWTLGDELRFSTRFLWVMSKLGSNGRSRLDVNIARRKDREWRDAQELFDAELDSARKATLTIGGETKPLYEAVRAGPSKHPNVYEMINKLPHDGSLSHQLLFVHEGIGYVVTFKGAADATPAELAELDSVRRSMGL